MALQQIFGQLFMDYVTRSFIHSSIHSDLLSLSAMSESSHRSRFLLLAVCCLVAGKRARVALPPSSLSSPTPQIPPPPKSAHPAGSRRREGDTFAEIRFISLPRTCFNFPREILLLLCLSRLPQKYLFRRWEFPVFKFFKNKFSSQAINQK